MFQEQGSHRVDAEEDLMSSWLGNAYEVDAAKADRCDEQILKRGTLKETRQKKLLTS